MKILYFHQYFNTPNASGGTRSYEFARRWVASGHDVTVITGMGTDPTLKPGLQIIDGIQVRCLGARYSNTQGFLQRIIAFLTYALRATWYALRAKPYDIVVATSTPLTVAIPALAAKWVARRKVVFEVRDVWPDAAIDAGVLKNKPMIWLARKLEKITYRHVNHVVPLSTGMQDNIYRKGVPSSMVTMLPNCSDLELFDPDKLDRKVLRKELEAEEKFIVLYVGAISLANDMPFLAKAMAQTKDKSKLEWWFVGEGNKLDYLKQQVQERLLGNATFWGKQPKEKVPQFVCAADVGIVSFISTPTYYENSPNKFFDYSAGGLPAIFTRTTWLRPYLEKYHAGYICHENTVDEFVDYIRLLVSKPELRHQMAKNTRQMAKIEFSRDAIASRYLKLLQSIYENKS